jgi:hypothetical protein
VSERLRRLPPGALLGALVAVVALVLYTQAVRVGGWSPDEEYFVDLSRVLADRFPESLWDVPEVEDYDDRGLQRLLPLVLAVPLGVLGGEAGVRLAHALLCLAFASAAVPGYLLARGVALGARWALAAALLVVLVPWAVLSTGFLTESLAYPLALWAFWAAWRACLVPGLRADLLALALVLAAAFARTSLLVLVVVAPVAVVAHAVLTGRARALPRAHPLLTAFAAVGSLLVAVSLAGGDALGTLGGSYNTSLTEVEWAPLPEKFAGQLARIVVGTGLVLAALAVAWSVAAVARRRGGDPRAQALALVALVAVPALVLSTVYAAPEERYLIYAAPLVVVPAVAALARRDVPAWGVALAGVAAALLVDRVAWPFAEDPAFFQTDAARTFLSRAVLSRVDVHLVALALLLGTLVVAALLLRRVPPRRAALGAGAVLAGVVAFQLVQTGYVLAKRVETTRGVADLHDRTWLDRAADGREVAQFGDGIGNTTVFEATWRELAFFNRSITTHLAIGGGAGTTLPRLTEVIELEEPRETGGALRPRTGDARLPRLWLVPTVFHPTGVVADPVARPDYLPVELVRLRGAPRAAYQWSDEVADDGWIEGDEPDVGIDLFPAARRAGTCLKVTLTAPVEVRGRHRFVVEGDGVLRRGALRAGERREVSVPLSAGVGELELRTSGSVRIPGDRRLALQVVGTALGRC